MTVGPASVDPSLVDPSLAAPETPVPDPRASREAAQQFESLVVRQLLAVLRKTAPSGTMMGGGQAGEMYMQMFDDAIAERLAEGGGIGLGSMLEGALGGAVEALPSLAYETDFRRYAGPRMGAPLPGAGANLQAAASELLQGSHRWSREGQLLPRDLQSDFSTETPGGEARFNVRDANGYRGYYKCNLFAFELARRAGFQVPVSGRHRGWGYPAPNSVTVDASDGRLERSWARVVTGETRERLDAGLQAGERGLMLTGSAAAEGRAGHMAIIERIHEIDYDDDGMVRRVVFDGWEARRDGAQHLTRRTWNRRGNFGGNLARNGFANIEILELRRPQTIETPEVPISRRAGASNLDNRASSLISRRPNEGLEE
ncbi:MAG: rod-binding protein [Myxococcota bacterium]